MATTEESGDIDVLRKEIASFAAEVGLASDPSGNGFYDADFRPDIATVKLSGTTNDETATAKKKASKESRSKGKADTTKHAKVDAGGVNQRPWNTGAGARPGGNKTPLDDSKDSDVWYEVAEAIPKLTDGTGLPPAEVVQKKVAVAEKLIENGADIFSKSLARKNPADHKWFQTVRTSGTSRDKMAANALLVQQSVVYNLRALDELISLASKRGGAQAAAGHVVDVLKELFCETLLPDRRLVSFHERPLHHLKPSKAADKLLVYWYIEDCIKKRYTTFLQALEEMSICNLEWVKSKALTATFELLAAKPEQEAKLLTMLVNKLGDPVRKVASKSGYLIACLLTQHPRMGLVIVREIESFLFRPNQKARAIYYAIITLNQMVLSKHPAHGVPVASKLVDIYFSLFQLLLSGSIGHASDQQAHREYVKPKKTTQVRKFKGSKAGHFSVKSKPKPAAAKAEDVDARLLSAIITGVRRAHPYVDGSEVRKLLEKHGTALFRTVHAAPLTVSVQALVLIYQVISEESLVNDRFYTALYAVLLRPGLERSKTLQMLFGLIFNALSADASLKRVAAMCKRLLQIATSAPANVACATLFVVSELLKQKAGLWTAMTQAEDHLITRSASNPAEIDEIAGSEDEQHSAEHTGLKSHHKDCECALQCLNDWPSASYYDMKKRSPQHANAETACWWELSALRMHMHPSVSVMADTLLAGASIVYKGNPLADLTLVAFLDKFVKRKPKNAEKGHSIMQPIASTPVDEVLHKNIPVVGSAAFTALAQQDVTAEDVFFHRYFTLDQVRQRRATTARNKKLRKKKDESGSENDSADEGQDYGSDAEDEFLEGLEQLQDDAFDVMGGVEREISLESEGTAEALSIDFEGEEEEEEDHVDIASSVPLKVSAKKGKKRDDKLTLASYEDYAHVLDHLDRPVQPKKRTKR